MSRRLLIAATALLLAGAAAWGAWTIAAHRAEQRADRLQQEIDRIIGQREEVERQRAELEVALKDASDRLETAEARLDDQLTSHREVVGQINARLGAMGHQVENDGQELTNGPDVKQVPDSFELALEPPAGLTLEDAWSGWRSCEATLGATLNAREECRQTLQAEDALLEASRRVEEELRAEIAARQELEQQLRTVATRRRIAGRLKLVGAALAGYGGAQLLD